jgi:hypothetical protein
VAETAELYEEDFYAWTRNQTAALRRLAAEQWNGPLDLDHLAEEVEDLGNSQRYAVESQIERVLEHLLKLEHAPAADPRRGWLISVLNARNHVRRRMTAAIRREVEPSLEDCYARSLRVAVLDESWFPANQHGLVDRVA